MADEIFTLPDRTKVQAFLDDLTEVCHRHGIGLSGEPTLYVLEPWRDAERRWRTDDDSNVEFI